ncbi:Signal transduction histidine kinase [Clostridium amylolyticum]|uniref:histidine kinase n=2 Tax=Clostridium amylolyticum TaxID=1121298 RepID=A0A1M6MUX3_9CLOT|nr:Signal transduction histidine kinase [Clostridium amylolyticum]
MLVIFTSIFILELLLIGFVKQYYYNNTEQMLLSQIKVSADFYSRYFANSTLRENITESVDVFWNQTEAQVQIIDIKGTVLLDSLGVLHDEPLSTIDVKKALTGESGRWIGQVDYDAPDVMAVSYPLEANGKIIGVIRFVTTLNEVNKSINMIALIFISIGLAVLFITIIVSVFLANSIIVPIKELTDVAEHMASGDLTIRSKKSNEDEIGKLSDTLNYMAEELKNREILKNEFISSVSHELRTPLTSIKGWVVTLNDDNVDKEMLNMGFEIIEKEADRLAAMVEELLDFSKFVSGKVTLKKQYVFIKEIIDYIEISMRARAEREGIQLIVNVEEDIPQVLIDSNRIKQVLINLLDNAFKFTNVGGEVELLISKDEKNLYLIVRDNGYGIAKEDLPRIKEKFYKGKTSKSKNGIGLSICDEIVKLHKGSLDFVSELDVGTEVKVTLPL